MTKPEIELRRQQLSEQYLALLDGLSARGLEICEELGQFAEEEDNLMRRAHSEIVEAEDRRRR